MNPDGKSRYEFTVERNSTYLQAREKLQLWFLGVNKQRDKKMSNLALIDQHTSTTTESYQATLKTLADDYLANLAL